MSSLAAFNRQLSAFGRQVEQAAVDKLKAAIVAVVDEVVNRTPIDTSRARTNWQTIIGGPATAEVPFVMGAAGSTASQAYQRAMASAEAATKAVRLGNRVWVSNCVPYIHELNKGTSQQAPPNFVDHAADAAKVRIAK
jgi:hypothetical protein